MHKLLAATAALMTLAGCDNLDPTQKHDYGCSQTFASQSACAQFRLTETEAIAARQGCERDDGVNGTWRSDPCTATDRTPGYCKVEASEYSLSGTDVRMYFYGIPVEAAEAACESEASNEWVPPAS